jgi:hypothetical protein
VCPTMPPAHLNGSTTTFSWWLALVIATGVVAFTQGAALAVEWPHIPQVKCRLILRGAQFSTASLTCDSNVTLNVAPELRKVLKVSPPGRP